MKNCLIRISVLSKSSIAIGRVYNYILVVFYLDSVLKISHIVLSGTALGWWWGCCWMAHCDVTAYDNKFSTLSHTLNTVKCCCYDWYVYVQWAGKLYMSCLKFISWNYLVSFQEHLIEFVWSLGVWIRCIRLACPSSKQLETSKKAWYLVKSVKWRLISFFL